MGEKDQAESSACQATEVLQPLDEWESHAANPRNWSAGRRWSLVVIFTVTNLVASMTNAFAPGVDEMLRDFHAQAQSLEASSVSIYTLGYCVGPLLIAPMSEIYGRIWPQRVAYPTFLAALAICVASNNLPLFIIFRAVMGVPAITLSILATATVPDIMPEERRGVCVSVIVTATGLGPTIGPIMGGFIIQHADWRWTLWTYAIAFSFCMVVGLALLSETSSLVLKAGQQHAGSSTSSRPSMDQVSAHTSPRGQSKALLNSPWLRPFQMLIRLSMVLLFTIYSTTANASTVIMYATLGLTFEKCYDFSASDSGLAYLGMAVGFLFSQITFAKFSDMWLVRMRRRRGSYKPEDRLPPLVLGAFVMPLALLMYGWGTRAHWMVPIVGSGLFAVGFMYAYLPVTTYLVDAYPSLVASALGASIAVRQITGAVLPLAAEPRYNRLSYTWGNSLLAFFALLFAPFTFILVLRDEQIRSQSTFEAEVCVDGTK